MPGTRPSRLDGTRRLGAGPALVGRDLELTWFDDHLAATAGGSARAVVVSGEAGAGKSVFLDALACRALGRDFQVLRATGFEAEQELPYAALHSLLAPVLGEGPASGPLGAALGGALDGGDTVPPRLATCQAVLALVSGLAAGQPLLLALDDAQWIDPASLQVLLFVAHRLDADAVLLVLVRRTGIPGPLDGVPFGTLDLGGLDETAAVALLAAHDVVPDVARRARALTGGNPLALLEGAARLDGDQRAGRSALPATWPLAGRLLEHFTARLAALPEPARLALAVTALEPTGDRAVIDGAVLRLGGDRTALALAEQAGVVRDRDGTLVWRHPLVAAAALHDLSAPRRRELHRALGATDPARLHPDRIAWHLAEGAAEPDESLADRLEQIGNRRTEQGAFDAAARAYERAAALSEDGAHQQRRLVLAAHRLVAATRLDEVVERYAPLVDTFDDPLAAADLARMVGQAELWTVGTGVATRRLQREAVRVEPASPERSAQLLGHAVVAQLLGLVPDAAHATAREALAVLDRRGGPPDAHRQVMEALELICAVLAADRCSAPGELDAIAEVLVALLAAGWPDASALLHVCAQAMLAEDGHGAVLDLAERSLRMAERTGMDGRELLARMLRADCLWRLGRWTESLAEISLVISVDEASGGSLVAALARCQLARTEAGLGLVEPCRTDARAAIDAADHYGLPFAEAQARAALMLLALGEGDPDAAVVEVDRLSALAAGAAHPGWLWWQADAIEALHGAGQKEAARHQLVRLTELGQRTGNRWAAAAVERGRARLGLADPVAGCTRAAAGFAEIGARFDEARAVLLRGECRQQMGDGAAAGDLAEAAARFERIGATAWHARATRSIEGATAAAPLSVRLSAAELRVAHAVGRGSSNRQVADELYLSVKTVESHLRSIYRKLGLRRRTQLVVLMTNPDVRVFSDS